MRVTADTDVAVHEQDDRPSALAGHSGEHRPQQRGVAAQHVHRDCGRRDVHAERGDPTSAERTHEPTRAAPDVECRPAAARENRFVGGVDRIQPSRDVEGDPAAVGRA